MHVLIVGSRGQLGQALTQHYTKQPSVRITQAIRPEFDLTRPQSAEQVAALRPDLVINCAAWTDVDGAEANPNAAYAANALGPQYLATGAARCGAALVQVSTNEIFPGAPGQVYREYDQPQPSSVYARSKLAGEIAVRQLHAQVYLVRVAWLFGPHGNNFPSKITAAADKHGKLRVVADEVGNPTYAPDAAAAIAKLAESGLFGSYHLINEGVASRFAFAEYLLQTNGRAHIPLTPIAHTEWPRPTQPPLHAVLVNQAAAALGITLRPWQEAVNEYVQMEGSR